MGTSEHQPVTEDPATAFTELEELLKELHTRYGNNQDAANEDEAAGRIDSWPGVFEAVEKLRNLIPSDVPAKVVPGRPVGFAARLGYWVGRTFLRRGRNSGDGVLAEIKRVVHRVRGCNFSDSYCCAISGLRLYLSVALSELNGANQGAWSNFHGSFVQALRNRYRLVHNFNWDAEGELQWMKSYLDLPVHTPWLTNYLLTTVFDRRILGARSDLGASKGKAVFNLAVLLSLVIVVYLLFAFGFAWLAWPAVAFLIWRFSQEWKLFGAIMAVEIRGSVLESARTEIVAGCYDAEEISRRLQRKELTVAFPSLVYPLLKLGASLSNLAPPPRILLVEDEQPVRDVIAPMLLSAGYSCWETATGRSAIDLLRSGVRIDLVLSNVLLPEVDGFTLLLHVKKNYPRTPFVFVTAINDASAKAEATRNGADGYLLKPFEKDELLAVIRSVLGSSPRIEPIRHPARA